MQIEAALNKSVLRASEEVLFASRASVAFGDAKPGAFAITPQRVLYAAWQGEDAAYATRLSLRWDSLECVAPIADMRGFAGLVIYPKEHPQAMVLLEAEVGSEREVTELVQQLIDARAPYSDDTCPALRVAGDFHHRASGIVVPAKLPGFARQSLFRQPGSEAIRAQFVSSRHGELAGVTIEIGKRDGRTLQEAMAVIVAEHRDASPGLSGRDVEPVTARLLGVPSTGLLARFRAKDALTDELDRALFEVGDWRVSIEATRRANGSRRRGLIASVAESLVRVPVAEPTPSSRAQ